MDKENLRVLLADYYERRVALEKLINFYEHELYEFGTSRLVWLDMRDKTQKELDELDIDIQYIQHQLKDE